VIHLLIANATEVVTSRTDARGAVGAALRELGVIADGAVAIDKGRIVEVGPTRVATPSSACCG
jgi:imidazolonepropionase-like amidohydrolase